MSASDEDNTTVTVDLNTEDGPTHVNRRPAERKYKGGLIDVLPTLVDENRSGLPHLTQITLGILQLSRQPKV